MVYCTRSSLSDATEITPNSLRIIAKFSAWHFRVRAIGKAETRKQNGRSHAHIFECLTLTRHPYYLKAWDRLAFNVMSSGSHRSEYPNRLHMLLLLLTLHPKKFGFSSCCREQRAGLQNLANNYWLALYCCPPKIAYDSFFIYQAVATWSVTAFVLLWTISFLVLSDYNLGQEYRTDCSHHPDWRKFKPSDYIPKEPRGAV